MNHLSHRASSSSRHLVASSCYQRHPPCLRVRETLSSSTTPSPDRVLSPGCLPLLLQLLASIAHHRGLFCRRLSHIIIHLHIRLVLHTYIVASSLPRSASTGSINGKTNCTFTLQLLQADTRRLSAFPVRGTAQATLPLGTVAGTVAVKASACAYPTGWLTTPPRPLAVSPYCLLPLLADELHTHLLRTTGSHWSGPHTRAWSFLYRLDSILGTAAQRSTAQLHTDIRSRTTTQRVHI